MSNSLNVHTYCISMRNLFHFYNRIFWLHCITDSAIFIFLPRVIIFRYESGENIAVEFQHYYTLEYSWLIRSPVSSYSQIPKLLITSKDFAWCENPFQYKEQHLLHESTVAVDVLLIFHNAFSIEMNVFFISRMQNYYNHTSGAITHVIPWSIVSILAKLRCSICKFLKNSRRDASGYQTIKAFQNGKSGRRSFIRNFLLCVKE